MTSTPAVMSTGSSTMRSTRGACSSWLLKVTRRSGNTPFSLVRPSLVTWIFTRPPGGEEHIQTGLFTEWQLFSWSSSCKDWQNRRMVEQLPSLEQHVVFWYPVLSRIWGQSDMTMCHRVDTHATSEALPDCSLTRTHDMQRHWVHCGNCVAWVQVLWT